MAGRVGPVEGHLVPVIAIYICICTCTCICICIYTEQSKRGRVDGCVCVRVRVCMESWRVKCSGCELVWVRAREDMGEGVTHPSANARTHARMHTYTHAHTYYPG